MPAAGGAVSSQIGTSAVPDRRLAQSGRDRASLILPYHAQSAAPVVACIASIASNHYDFLLCRDSLQIARSFAGARSTWSALSVAVHEVDGQGMMQSDVIECELLTSDSIVTNYPVSAVYAQLSVLCTLYSVHSA